MSSTSMMHLASESRHLGMPQYDGTLYSLSHDQRGTQVQDVPGTKLPGSLTKVGQISLTRDKPILTGNSYQLTSVLFTNIKSNWKIDNFPEEILIKFGNRQSWRRLRGITSNE